MRKFSESSLLIATKNLGKISEITDLLSNSPIKLFSALDYSIKPPLENLNSFAAHAKLKARYYGQLTNMAALADDSGLCIADLNDQPGVNSSHWALNNNYDLAFSIIKDELNTQGKATSKAKFICVLSLWWPDDFSLEFTGQLSGYIQFPPVGKNGFGYDSIFIPDNHNQTLAELSSKQKNALSHRGIAFDQLFKSCFNL